MTARAGVAIHIYRATSLMTDRVFGDADGDQADRAATGARLLLRTELGGVDPAHSARSAVIPRAVCAFPRRTSRRRGARVCLRRITARCSRCRIGAGSAPTALAPNARDFLTPAAWYEELRAETECVVKFAGSLWATKLDNSPLDVVAWHGNYAPYKYDLARFMTLGTVSFDHPDPSIFTVLTAPTDTPGTANCDFVVFPPRWMVAEDTFRPPWFHRNLMSEFMGLVRGVYDAKAAGFVPGGASLHNSFSAHGPDRATFDRASTAELMPHKVTDTLAFMFETRLVIRPTEFALNTPALQHDYDDCWSASNRGFIRFFDFRGGGGAPPPAPVFFFSFSFFFFLFLFSSSFFFFLFFFFFCFFFFLFCFLFFLFSFLFFVFYFLFFFFCFFFFFFFLSLVVRPSAQPVVPVPPRPSPLRAETGS